MAHDPDLDPILNDLAQQIGVVRGAIGGLDERTAAALKAIDERLKKLEVPVPPPPPPPPPPPDPDPEPDPDPDPPPAAKERTTPLRVGAGATETGWLVRDCGNTSPYPTAVTVGEGGTLTNTTVRNVAQAIEGGGVVNLRDVIVEDFAGIPTQQAHGVYTRHGLCERVTVRRMKPNSGNGSCSFHAHKENGYVENLTWKDCVDETGADAVMAGYVGVRNCTIDGFTKPTGKLRLGAAGKANGRNSFLRLKVATLQLDGSFAAGTIVAGTCRELTTAGGPGMTNAQAAALFPGVDFSGLTRG
jgi:hypothetical protein